MAVETKSKKKKPKAIEKKKTTKSLFDEKPKQDDLSQLLQDVQERPLVYAGIAAFLVACLLAGFLYRANTVAKRKDVLTAYAQALDKEEPADQLAALEPLSQDLAKKNDEVVYMTGETAYRAGAYDKAKAAFERMRTDFKDSPYAPEAVEGLGNIAENAKDYDSALTYYREIGEKWGSSFAARRQPMNIAKLEERRGRLSEAVTAYREQMQLFPGSTLANEASAALTRIEKSNPDLFPKTDMPAADSATADAAAAAGLNLQLEAPTAMPETSGDATTETPGAGTAAPVESETPAPAESAAPAAAEPAPAPAQ